MRCRSCREKAVVEIERHNAAFCKQCFLGYCRRQVERAVEGFGMFHPADRILVAVSGGKDSLALWDILHALGYDAEGLYLNLGIGSYSERSESVAASFAAERGLKLHAISIREEYGFGIPEGARGATRPTCSLCGMSKRHLLNRFAYEHGYDVLATGHNLDDEAATLLSNLLRWEIEYLMRQWPVLPAREGFAKKVKPLIRLAERETAAYCVLSGIDYVVEECPLVGGNTQLAHKEALDVLERRSPGVKARLLLGFLKEGASWLRTSVHDDRREEEEAHLVGCGACGSPTPTTTRGSAVPAQAGGLPAGDSKGQGEPLCAFCREASKIALRLGRNRPPEAV